MRTVVRRFGCVLLLAVLHVGVAGAQHKVGLQGAVITKYRLTDKLFLNQYGEYCHDSTNERMNYWIAKPLGVGYDFTKWLTLDFGYYYFQFKDSGMHRPELSLIFTHRENNLQFQYQKRLVMDKNTESSYYDWYHRSHYTISYDIPESRFTPVVTFEFYLKNGIKQCRFHGGPHISLTDKSKISVQLFNVTVPGTPCQ